MIISKTVIILSHLPILLTVVYAALCFRRLENELRVFCYFIFFSGLIQFASLLLWFLRRNNMPLLHVYVAGGFLLIAWFYRTLLKDFINSKIIWSMAILFLLFTVINSLFVQTPFTFNSHALTVESILIIILALFTFIFLLNGVVKETVQHDTSALNWINSGLFIYHSSTLLISYFGNTIVKTFSVDLNLYTWIFHSFFSIVMYTCFFISLWKRSKT